MKPRAGSLFPIKLMDSCLRIHPGGIWVVAFLICQQTSAQAPASAEPPRTAIHTSIQRFLQEARSWGESSLVRLTGVVTHSTSDKTFFIQEAGAGVYVFHRPEKRLMTGDSVEVTGNPSLGGLVPTLQNCTTIVVGQAPEPSPVPLLSEEMNQLTNAMKLVRLTGRLNEHRLGNGRTLIVRPENASEPFSVEAEALPDIEPLNQIPGGCLLEATGILTHRKGPAGEVAGARLLIRSAADLVVREGPPFWTRKRIQQAATGTTLAFVIAAAWVLLLRREVRRQTVLISQRLEREAALKASEDRFLKVFKATPDPVLIARASDELLLDVNPAFERITGHSREEAMGHTTEELGLWADKQARLETLKKFNEGASVSNLQVQARHRNGEPLWGLISMEWIELNGEKCWLSVVRDITAQKQAEDQRRHVESMLQHSQKMEALGTLAGGIAHDFNNILAAILINAELARTDAGPVSDSARDNLDAIHASAERAKNLVQQILAFSRKQDQEKQLLNLESLVTESAKLLRAVTPAAIRIETKIQPDCPPVLADPAAILQVIINLGTNGCHAMELRPGLLMIELESVKVDGLQAHHPALCPGSYLRLTVSDQGEGMAPETIERIFDPFFTTKAPGKGTGLGLAVSHRTVTDHHGVILVESKPGLGSKFSVYIPASSIR